MGISERKEQAKEIRRQDIIKAAEKVIFSKGYLSATMDDIANEAEFSKRTVYVYFNSKEQIYFAIMVHGYKLLIGLLEHKLQSDEESNALEKIRQIGLIIYRFSNDYPDYFRAIMEYENREPDFDNSCPDNYRDECYVLGERLLGYLIDNLKQGVKEGVIRPEIDVINTALVLWSCSVGVFNSVNKKAKYIMHYHNRTADEIVSDAFNMFIRAIQIDNGGIRK